MTHRGRFAFAALLIAAAHGQTPPSPQLTSMVFPRVDTAVMYGLGARPLSGLASYPVRSDDAGRTWIPLYVFEAGTAQGITGIAVDPNNAAVVYAATTMDRGGVWKSTNSGRTWTAASTGLPAGSLEVKNLTVAANNGQVLYARVGEAVYKTTDAGGSWSRSSALPASGGLLAIVAQDPARMYLMVRGGAAFRSSDGVSWQSVGAITVQRTVEPNLVARYLAIDPSDPDTVYACIDVDSSLGLAGTWGFWQSTDGGTSWANVYETPQAPAARFVVVDPVQPNVHLSVGFFGHSYARSRDRGRTFTDLHGATFAPLAADPRNPNLVYGNGGRMLSRDAGTTVTATGAAFRPTFPRITDPLRFELEQGSTITQTIRVVPAEGELVMAFTATVTGAGWLTAPSPNGTTPEGIGVQISTAGLSPGEYSGTLQLASSLAMGPGAIPVQLVVRARTPSGASFLANTIASDTGTLGSIGALAQDAAGSIYFGAGLRVRRLDRTSGQITTVAGNGIQADSGDGGPATEASFQGIDGLAIDGKGDVYISDRSARRIRVVSGGTIRTLFDRNTGAIGSVGFLGPKGMCFDSTGRLLIAGFGAVFRWVPGRTSLEIAILRQNQGNDAVGTDRGGAIYVTSLLENRVYVQRPGSALSVFAGTGQFGFNGDGQPANSAQLFFPQAVGADESGNVFILESLGDRVRMVSPDGVIRTVAGGGTDSTGNGILATLVNLSFPQDMVVEANGNILVSQTPRIRRLTKLATAPPSVVEGSFLNAASNLGRLSPGSLFSFYGLNMASSTTAATSAPWPTTLGGATVRINNTAVPLNYASPGQVNGQVPYEAVAGSATATVTVNGITSAPVRFQVLASSPGLLQFGDRRAVAVNPDGSVNTAGNPAPAGSVVVVYFIGTGRVNPAVATGAAVGAEPLAVPALPSRVLIGDQEVRALFLGLAPGFVGLGQANIELPALTPGDYPLTIVIGDEPSNTAFVSIRAR